ncbi:unnamed protein product, partial [Closterium sp. Naga37s-1]
DKTLSKTFRWEIDKFSSLAQDKMFSKPAFLAGGYNWRVLLFPRGNTKSGQLSLYLDVADAASLPSGWNKSAHFVLCVINHYDRKMSVRRDTSHQFNEKESDWGFTSFMSLQDLNDPSKGYLINDTLVVEVEVNVLADPYDSRKETGFVGLKNQGATCYLNAVLQMLYHIPFFQAAVYRIPTSEDDPPSSSIPLALQSIFYKLQHADSSVSTKHLTRSFGWDTYDSFLKHDAHELNRVLCAKVEDKMEGMAVADTVKKLFGGHAMSLIDCTHMDCMSARKEPFLDVQLDVKGCRDVYASLDKYVEVEELGGDNKFYAEQHGFQDARMRVLFVDLPPVLQLHMKRFEYDATTDAVVKLNDRFEFPQELDMDTGNHKYLSPLSDTSVRNLYLLHRWNGVGGKRSSKEDTYDDVVRELAEKLELPDPSKIRLTRHNCYLQQPRQSPVKFRSVNCLEELLAHHDQMADILYYETLDIPLPKLERLKSLGIAFSNKSTSTTCFPLPDTRTLTARPASTTPAAGFSTHVAPHPLFVMLFQSLPSFDISTFSTRPRLAAPKI